MKLFKRIITSLLIIVTCVSLCFTTVFAAWYNDAAYLYSTCGIGQWVADAVLTGGGGALGGYLGGLAGTVTLPGIGTVNGAAVGKAIGVAAGHTGKEALDAFMNYLAQDSSFVSEEDYIAALDTPIITFADTGFHVIFDPYNPDLDYFDKHGFVWLDSDNTGFSFRLNRTAYYHGFYWRSRTFSVAEEGRYFIDFGEFYKACGSSLGSYSVTLEFLSDSGSWGQVSSVLVSSGSTSRSSDAYGNASITVDERVSSAYLVPSRKYRVVYDLGFSGSSVYHDELFLFKVFTFPLVYRKNETVVPASTRVSSLTQTINNYNTTNNTTNYYIGTTDATGKVNQVYDSNLFDEQKMVFTEPVSGVQYQCVGWKYYYDDRAYILELADNSLSYNGTDIKYLVLQYGDDAVHILGYSSATTLDNLDFVFSDDYAYVIATATNANPEACQHVYTSETVTAPTCTEQGVRRYTCELCGYTRDEKIPATGHAWEATEIVETELNENGDVTKLGYTVYTCSACGETYKQYDNTGQPGPPGSDDPGTGSASGSGFWDRIKNAVETALASLIESVLTLITTVLTSLLSLVMDLLSFFFSFLSDTVISGIGGFFSSFTDGSLFEFFKSDNGTGYELPEGVAGVFAFFSGIFLCLPDDLRFVLIFGIGLTFFLAVFKLVHS